MATEQFRIRARIVAVDDTREGLSSVDRGMDRLENRAQATGLTISRFLGGAFALLGGGAALGVAARGVVGLQTEIQNAEGSLATLFAAFEGVEISEAMKMAKAEVDALSRSAATGVGGLQDYLDAFQLLFSPARAAGASFEQIEKFSKDALTAASAMGKELGQAPLDIVQALQQGVNDKITPIASQALKAAGISAEEFNKLDVRSKMEALSKGFGKFSAGAELMGQQWDAQVETLLDGIKRMLRIVTAPLFERWSEQLRSVNRWIGENEDRLTALAEEAGPKLLDFFDSAIEKARTLAAITAGIVVAEQARGLVGKGKGGGGLGGVLSQVPSGLVPGAGPVRGVRGGFARSSGFVPITATLKGLLSVLGRLAGPAALLALAFAAIEGATRDFPEFFAGLASEAAFAAESVMLAVNSLGAMTAEGSALNLVGLALLLPLRGLGTALGIVARGVGLLFEVLNLALLGLGNLLNKVGPSLFLIGNALGLVSDDRARVAAQGFREANEKTAKGGADSIARINRLLGRGPKAGTSEEDAALDKATGSAAKGKGGTTINVAKMEVTAKTEQNADPTSVVKTWEEVVEDLNRFRRQPKQASGVTF